MIAIDRVNFCGLCFFFNLQELSNRSLIKYLLIIEEFRGWCLFQRLLLTLRVVADRAGSITPPGGGVRMKVSIAMVAICYILRQKQVSSVIVGGHCGKLVCKVHMCLTI